MEEDFELLAKFKKGDQQAFELLVRKYKTTVYNTIYSIIGNAQEADDIAQEVFLKVYTKADSFKGKSSFSTWLYRITVNRCVDELRRRKNKIISYETEFNQEEKLKLKDVLASRENDITEKLRQKELQDIIQKAMNSLPEKYRIILTLKEIEGLSYKEISQIMKISLAKVKIWLFRARQKLKGKLAFLYSQGE
ncbi:MAG: sigma-70 family RNA polymerase sigma factor [Candidatus Aminicenantes bacterium]|nr:MAG: sigma-70 family RNA polymerase sigma factor [Candidatus Aminicenantes bacterium]